MTEAAPRDNQEALRAQARQQAAQHLWRLLYEVGCRPDEWNGGEVVTVVEGWLVENGVDTSVEPTEGDNS